MEHPLLGRFIVLGAVLLYAAICFYVCYEDYLKEKR